MDAQYWISLLLLGALCGAMGQLTRLVAGVAKSKSADKDKGDDRPGASTLTVGMLIGGLAGALAALAVVDNPTPATNGQLHVSMEQVLGLIAAGYAGTDFIEGVAGKYLPKSESVTPRTNDIPTPVSSDTGALG